jgi:hypothetical protein
MITDKKTRDLMTTCFGALGELYVYLQLCEEGRKVELSDNFFDDKKDMVADGKLIEVKSQVAWIRENAFTVSVDQLVKCQTVDELYFVCVPHPSHKLDDSYAGWIYKLEKDTWTYRVKSPSDYRRMVLIPREQDAVKRWHQLSKPQIEAIKRYNVTE